METYKEKIIIIKKNQQTQHTNESYETQKQTNKKLLPDQRLSE